MTGVITRRETCRLCGGEQLELALPLAPAPVIDDYIGHDRLSEIQDTYPMDVYLCNQCGHSQLVDVVDPQIIYGRYIYETTSSPGLVEHFRGYAEDVSEKLAPASDSLVVDIGSNDGTLLRFFKTKGFRVLGVDPAPEIAERATHDGIETLPIFFSVEEAKKIRNKWGPASIITANNLFANVDNLYELTDAIHDLLHDDGVFILETFYVLDLVRNMVFDFLYHEHLNCFSVRPLAEFFSRHGLQLIDVQRVPTKGGSMRILVQKANGPRQVSPSVTEFIIEEEQAGAQSLPMFQDFSARIGEARDNTLTLLRDLSDRGMVIAGFGASATTTCMIYHYGIGQFLSFLVDDNPAKQDRFSPGHHIPVYAASAIYERRPDYVLIFAWRFADSILKNHQQYLQQGGHFILPLPEVLVI